VAKQPLNLSDDESETVRSKVASGTLKGVSVGYRVTNYESVKEGAKSLDGRFTGPCYIAKKWMPFEISIVSVPADATVGVGRDLHENGFPPPGEDDRPALSYFEGCVTANKNH
jgi:phage head maturation protease